VIKVGSSFLYSKEFGLDTAVIKDLTAQIGHLRKNKIEVVLVSSGAIAAGMSALNFSSRPKELARLQATASVGQHFLMTHLNAAFQAVKLECGQVLLTWEDFNARQRYLNAKNTLLTLLALGVVPVIN
jgi:glutamate 5-kinase